MPTHRWQSDARVTEPHVLRRAMAPQTPDLEPAEAGPEDSSRWRSDVLDGSEPSTLRVCQGSFQQKLSAALGYCTRVPQNWKDQPLRQPIADRLLAHLGLEREGPTLGYLHRLVRQHQLRVPFETLTKHLDYEPGLRRGSFLPELDEYVERIVTRGAGGLCWTLARGFHSLLDELGFEAALMMMHSGHCCVRVELAEGPFYADVGYAAPLFQAYPLFQSFTLVTQRETFEYAVREEGIFVTRQPGPAKRLDPTPRRLED